nr:zinc-finger domain-containing protein [Staphylococcus massiliensis]
MYNNKGVTIILTFEEKKAIQSIDKLMNQYCHRCLLKTHLRKAYGKTHAHQFCISECSVGKQIKQLGNELQ